MSRYTPVAEVRFRLNRAEGAWRQLVEIVQEEARKLGYTGPSPASVERVLDEIATVKLSLDYWVTAIAMRASQRSFRKSVREKAAEIIRRNPDTQPQPVPEITDSDVENIQRALAEVLPKEDAA